MLPLNKLHKVDTTNHSIVKYSESVAEQINQICEPFFIKSGLTMFGYHRTYRGGYMQVLTNLPWGVELIFKFGMEKYYPFPDVIPSQRGVIQHLLWLDHKEHPIHTFFYDNNVWHGYSIFECHK